MLCFRAFVYLSQNNYAEAHASFSDVLKIDPKNPVVGDSITSQTTFLVANIQHTHPPFCITKVTCSLEFLAWKNFWLMWKSYELCLGRLCRVIWLVKGCKVSPLILFVICLSFQSFKTFPMCVTSVRTLELCRNMFWISFKLANMYMSLQMYFTSLLNLFFPHYKDSNCVFQGLRVLTLISPHIEHVWHLSCLCRAQTERSYGGK